MAENIFKNATSRNIGQSGADVYQTPENKKSIIIGCSVSNITGASLPVEVQLVKQDGNIIHIAQATRIAGGTTTDFLSGKKLVMQSEEILRVISKVDDSFDCIVSLLEDVD